MPGRNGHTAQGGWESGHNIINGINYPTDLILTDRYNSTPTEYKATISIEFTDGFNDNGTDEYTAFIVDGTTTSNGTAGGSGVDVGGGYRYEFNGKERDKDISEGDLDFGARIYDSRLGRFLSIDPLEKKFPMLSPYCFAANSPIKLIDVNGLAPGDVVVAFGGADIYQIRDKGGATNIIQKVNELYIKKQGGKSAAFASQYWMSSLEADDLDRITQGAYDFIKNNYNKSDGKVVKGGKVIIEGYSFGGVLANHLAKRLEEDKITVDLLVTVDAAAGPASHRVDRTISKNVKTNLNIYQKNESAIYSRGDANTKMDPQTEVINSDYSNMYEGTPGANDYKESSHGTIDEMSESRVVNKIVEVLNKNRTGKEFQKSDNNKSKKTSSSSSSL